MKKNLANNIFLLITLTLLLKCIGFVNRIAIAYHFGTSNVTDIFYNASGFIDSISSIVLASLSVGVINIYINNKRENRNDKFISDLILICFTMMLIMSCVLFCLSDHIAYFLAPSYSSTNISELGKMLKYLSICFPFQGLIAVFTSILQAEKNFTPVKMVGTVSSMVSIICVILLTNRLGVYSLVVSYVVGIVFNTIILWYSSKKIFNFSFTRICYSDDLKKLLVLIGPLIIGIAAHEINLIIDKSIASGFKMGAISALSYSCVLYLLVENVFINSIVTALLPELTQNVANNKAIDGSVGKVVVFTELLLIPIFVIMFCFSTDIITLLYGRGNFDEYSISLTSVALKGYVIGLPFLGLRDIYMQVFYAFGNTSIPVKVNTISVVINIILDFVLSKYYGVMGIAIATSVSIAFSGIILTLFSAMRFKGIMTKEQKMFIGTECIIAVLLMAVGRFTSNFIESYFAVGIVAISILVLQFILAWILNFPYIRESCKKIKIFIKTC